MVKSTARMLKEEEQMLADVKNYLDITYEDEDTDNKLLGIMRRGMHRLNTIAGREGDYSQEGDLRGLLFDYCRYAMSSQTEAFETNYRAQLNGIAMEGEVEAYAANQV